MTIQLQHIRGAIVDPKTGRATTLFFDLLQQITQSVVVSEDITDSDLLELALDVNTSVEPAGSESVLDLFAATTAENKPHVDLTALLLPTTEQIPTIPWWAYTGSDGVVDNIRQDLEGFPQSLKTVNQNLTTTSDAQFNSIGANASTTDQGVISAGERSSDPSDPAEGEYVIWMSDGTGTGDDGDIMIKITAGGTTKTGTLVDFSAI